MRLILATILVEVTPFTSIFLPPLTSEMYTTTFASLPSFNHQRLVELG